MDLSYFINNKKVVVKLTTKLLFQGEDIILFEIGEDITRSMSWYSEGFKIYSLENVIDFSHLVEAITRLLKMLLIKT